MLKRDQNTRMDEHRKDHSYQKAPQKGTGTNNYRPITYLQMMWKIITVQIREEIYFYFINR